jgi:hypothetical protein
MDSQLEMGRNNRDETGKQLREAAAHERHKNERLAKQLSSEAMQQWQRSIEGLLALPTATALGLASSTLYVAAFIERGFEVLQQSTEAVRSGLEQGRREFREMERSIFEEERSGNGGQGRSDVTRDKAHS